MRLAIYSPSNIGHYGLGLTHYCHFTSPIRRYIDLVIHRILFDESDDLENLEMISLECSEQERASAKAEQSVVLLKKLRLLKSCQELDQKRQYEAVVTRVKPFGIFIEILEFMLESFLHVSELESDYFNYDEVSGKLIGVHHGMSYHSGDKVTVMLKEVNFITQESLWYLVASENNKKGKGKSAGKKPSSHTRRSSEKRSSKTKKTPEKRSRKRR
jgi:ribonuclease R